MKIIALMKERFINYLRVNKFRVALMNYFAREIRGMKEG